MTIKLPPGTPGEPAYAIMGCLTLTTNWIAIYSQYLDVRRCRLNYLNRVSDRYVDFYKRKYPDRWAR